jgi:hypothetical protein
MAEHDPREFLRQAGSDRLLDYLVGRASLAPSAYNSQPWRFLTPDAATVELRPDDSRRLPQADPEDRLLYLALGAALENLLIAAADLGYHPEVEWLPEEGVAVRVHLGEPGELPEPPDPRVDAMVRRRSARGRLGGDQVRERARATARNLELDPVLLDWPEPATLDVMLVAGEAAEREQWGREAFRAELARWLRRDRRESESLRDGLAFTDWVAVPRWAAGWLRRALLRYPGLFGAGRGLRRRLHKAPAVAVLSTMGDTRRDWLEAGQAYQRLGLALTEEGLSLAPESGLLASHKARKAASKVLGRPEPQIVARVGEAGPLPPQPRRQLPHIKNARPVIPIRSFDSRV